MNCQIEFKYDDGESQKINYNNVTSIICKPGECDTQDVFITCQVDDGREVKSFKTQRIYWVVNFQIIVK